MECENLGANQFGHILNIDESPSANLPHEDNQADNE
jgi:hypothetical protein